ncbi:MAG: RDD family protein [Flavitalea sp.]
MKPVKLDTGFNIEVEFSVAPFHKRLFAWIIDIVVCWLLVKILALVIHAESFFVWTNVWETKGLLLSLPVLFYPLFCEVAMNGRSVGKLAMNCRVITEEGGQPSLGQYLIRWVFRLVDFPYWIAFAVIYSVMPWWTMPLTFAGLASVIFTPKSQRIGDLVAGTILIDLRNSASWQDTVFTEIDAGYQPLYPQVMQLSDRDLNTLKSIIESVKKKDDQYLAAKIAERIKSKVKMETQQAPLEFLETLLKDYNYYSTR